MRFGSRKPVLSKPVLTLLGTFLILTVFAASNVMAGGTWSITGSTNHAFVTATLLTDGRVLVAGGCAASDPVTGDCLVFPDRGELYNPATGTWSATSTITGLFFFPNTATRLLDGRVLVTGQPAKIYDPTTDAWSLTGTPGTGAATATLLMDGTVLISSNLGLNGTSAELYNPITGTWSPTGSLSVCCLHSATRLRDGRVLFLGGPNLSTSAHLYDPTTGTWSATGSTSAACGQGTLLMDGTVLTLCLGGSAERYDPTTGTWSLTGTPVFSLSGQGPATATLLMDGTVLVTGGPNGTSAELYDPTTGTWSATASMGDSGFATATRLLDGRVLVAGGGPNGTSAELFTPSPPGPLFAAVLPTSRSVPVGTPATAFATIINAGTSTATGCQIAPRTPLPASFAFQTTDPATNALTGTVNTPVDIPPNAAQTFVFALTPTAAIPPTDVGLNFFCSNAMTAPVLSGIDTLLFSASTPLGPDIVALAATLNNDGIVNISGTTGTGVFAVATVNVGAGGTITASADMGAADLPVRIAMCQTDPMTARCVNPTVPTTSPVVTTINPNATPTFGIFVTGTSTVSFAPSLNRIFVRFTDAGGVPRGSTSVAVRTQ